MQPVDQWQYLLQQYLQDKATAEERAQLFGALQRKDVDWETLLMQMGLQQEVDASYRDSDWAGMIERIVQEPARERNRFLMNRWWMAAAVLVCIVCGVWLMVSRSKSKPSVTNTISKVQEVLPGKQGAILTLADGRQIVLDSAGNGSIGLEGNMVARHDGTQLVYEKNEPGKKGGSATTVAFNTLSTPRGRQFQLVLPDGSKVWLNAASSIRYPVVFNSDERRVEITGEVYFEVEKVEGANNKKLPFIVNIPPQPGGLGGAIEVLGTHFNVNAYDDEESIKTTLLEGRVKVGAGAASAFLQPGQQALITGQQNNIPVKSTDVQAAVAWKNGLFNFQDVPLQQVMRQLARWYDVEITYENGIPEIEFGGKMGRDLTLSNVLSFLEKSGLHCRLVNNRRLIVMP